MVVLDPDIAQVFTTSEAVNNESPGSSVNTMYS